VRQAACKRRARAAAARGAPESGPGPQETFPSGARLRNQWVVASSLAIYHPPGQLGLAANPFGKDVANLELYRALARHGGFETLHILAGLGADPAALAAALGIEAGRGPRVTAGLLLDQGLAAGAGTLLRGQPDLSTLAWLRRRAVGDRAYSLVGLIHTIAPPIMREEIAAAVLAPVQDWDAMICTSPAVRDALEAMFERWTDYLGERFGGGPAAARAAPRPRLPVIPLGVDADALEAQADRPEARARLRARLGLGEDDVLVIWVGRLSFFEKAFPQPMFRAVEEARAATGARVAFAMAGWFPNGETDRQRYEQAARAYAPDTPLHFLDGNDRALLGELWAAGDIFLSLVDNIQETFGITPVEAMAAGLPVVASDWDGYRFTVRHGVEGFLIPTLGGPPGPAGETMSARHAALLDSYQAYVGGVAQHTAVHVGRAAQALAELIASPDLRRRMGAAGRARVRGMLDWPVVVGQVLALTEELAAVRAAAADPRPTHRMHPVRGDPYAEFAGFPSHGLSLDTVLRIRDGASAADLARAQGLTLDSAFPGWRGSLEEAAQVLARLEGGARVTVRDLLVAFPPERRRPVQMSLVWLAKLGVLDWL
jgi:D-inositol-3-phosphate glycosyltransferase